MAISSEFNKIEGAYFNSFTGHIKEIRDFEGVEGSKFVTVKNEEEQIANFIISKDTYTLGEAEIEIGSIVTGYYDANAPMLMIYPPQYSVEVLVVEEEKEKFESIKV
ncbi:MAG: copper amine oxidase N-terminal domain-containing protein, partial [Clostridiaceae bacterium]|nr:copper amine oxidase N-terminal domain-containing protein [Clostridiaceae bacterium]